MIDAVSASLSGLRAAQKRLDVVARNVANLSTDGYKRSRVTLEEGSGGGVLATEERVREPGPVVVQEVNGGLAAVEKSNVDLVSEMGDLTVAKPLYQANLKALEAQDEMLGSLLDVVR